MNTTENSIQLRQIQFISRFAIVGISAALVFMTWNFLTGNFNWVLFNLVIVTGMGTIFLVLRITKSIKIVSTMGITIAFLTLGYQFLTGGVDMTGILWVAIFPVLAFFLKGSRMGVVLVVAFAMILSVGLSAGLWLGKLVNIQVYSYSRATLLHLFGSFAVVSFLSYFYAWVNEETWMMIKKHDHEMQKKNKQLQQEIRKRQQSDQALEDSNKELKKMNKLMIGRELKMAEMKKELAKSLDS